MSTEEKTMVLVCQNLDCITNGSSKILEEMQKAMADRDDIEVRSYMCFGTCHEGPNIVVYPKRDWYSNVKSEDIPDLIEAIQNGTRVDRICDQVDQGSRDFIYTLLDAGIY